MRHKMGFSFTCLILLISIVMNGAASVQPLNAINHSTLEKENFKLPTGKAIQLPEVYPKGEEALGLNPMDVEVVSELGGTVSAVAVQGSFAYLGLGLRLVILNIEKPALPLVVGKSGFLPGVVKHIRLAGMYAYAALESGGISIIDIHNPLNPIEIGWFASSGIIQDIVFRDNFLFLAESDVIVGGATVGGGLHILDIRMPTHLKEVWTYDAPKNNYYAHAVEVVGDYVYLGGNDGLDVIDISNPTSPEWITSLDLYAFDLIVQGNYVYAISIYGLVVLDVSQPANPKNVASLEVFGNHGAVNGDFLYIGNEQDGLVIVNIFTPTKPEKIGAFSTQFPYDIVVSSDYLYLVNGSEGLLSVDVSIPDKPVQAGRYSGLGTFSLLAVEGSYAYLASNEGLHLADISDKKNPLIVGFWDGLPHGITSFKILGDYAYLTIGSGMQILDVSIPADPVPLGFYPTPYTAWDVDIKGGFAYIATGSGSPRHFQAVGVLYVVDVSDPMHLDKIMELPLPDPAHAGWPNNRWVTDIVIEGDSAYVGNLYELRIVHLFEGGVVGEGVSSARVGDSIQDLDIENGHIYVTKSWMFWPEYEGVGLHIFQAHSLNKIAFIGDLGSPYSIDVDGSYAYVGSSNGLYLLDVTDPWDPVKVGFFNGIGGIGNMKVDGSYAYITGGSSGLIILRFFERHYYFPIISHNGSLGLRSTP